jgi:hypothetical protein
VGESARRVADARNDDPACSLLSWLCTMASIDPSSKLIEDYEHTLEMLDEALVAVRLLIRAHDTGRQMTARVLRRIQKQCTAAAVVSRRLKKDLRHLTMKKGGES